MEWYRLSPVDTLFFKGAEPMIMGENHTTSHLFPPPAHTLSGALRTAVLVQNSVSFADYKKGKAPSGIYDVIGEAGEEAPFDLVGPLFMYEGRVYVPAPFSWFREKDSGNGKVRVIKGRVLSSGLLRSGSGDLFWATGENLEFVSLGGMWVAEETLRSAEPLIEAKKCEDFFEQEPRTGIALHANRKVREGHLYSFNHVRLKMGVSLVFGTGSRLPLAEKGVLKVGGEQRFGWYEKVPIDSIPLGQEGDFYLSLSIVEGTGEANEAVVATGKPLYLGGWDLKERFHKSMKGFFPAGTLFNRKINNNFIGIRG
ncbi:MAG: hypothetical protein JRI80_17615 [Deltaproteobacteria bacterium]|nr:hypothetical protein [Deltaproteobacteria bacterium]